MSELSPKYSFTREQDLWFGRCGSYMQNRKRVMTIIDAYPSHNEFQFISDFPETPNAFFSRDTTMDLFHNTDLAFTLAGIDAGMQGDAEIWARSVLKEARQESDK